HSPEGAKVNSHKASTIGGFLYVLCGIFYPYSAQPSLSAGSHALLPSTKSKPASVYNARARPSGAGVWRPFHGHRTEAGAGRRRLNDCSDVHVFHTFSL